MVQKILLTMEIDDSAIDKTQAKTDKLTATLDAAQAKGDKLVATLKEAEEIMRRITLIESEQTPRDSDKGG